LELVASEQGFKEVEKVKRKYGAPEEAIEGMNAMDAKELLDAGKSVSLTAEITKITFPCRAKYVYLDGHEVVKTGVFKENVDEARKQGIKVDLLGD
jgi:hypothetical protein